MAKIKFLLATAPSGDEFVVHPHSPACIGKVVHDDAGKVRVYMEYRYADMTPQQEMDMCKEMKNWYYFSRAQK